jgi:hypothetical protein
MAAPKRTITNNYQDCRLVRLDANEPRSPLVVTQEGCAPNDPQAKTRLFYLQRDGRWIDEISRSTRPEAEAGDIVFETAGEVLELFSTLFGKPQVREVPITQADVDAYIAKVKSVSSPEAAYRDFLARYRAAKNKR